MSTCAATIAQRKFVLVTGVEGSGTTMLARVLGQCCESCSRFAAHSDEGTVGNSSRLESSAALKSFDRFVMAAWNVRRFVNRSCTDWWASSAPLTVVDAAPEERQAAFAKAVCAFMDHSPGLRLFAYHRSAPFHKCNIPFMRDLANNTRSLQLCGVALHVAVSSRDLVDAFRSQRRRHFGQSDSQRLAAGSEAAQAKKEDYYTRRSSRSTAAAAKWLADEMRALPPRALTLVRYEALLGSRTTRAEQLARLAGRLGVDPAALARASDFDTAATLVSRGRPRNASRLERELERELRVASDRLGMV